MEKIAQTVLRILEKDIFWDFLLALVGFITTLAGVKSFKDRRKRYIVLMKPTHDIEDVRIKSPQSEEHEEVNLTIKSKENGVRS